MGEQKELKEFLKREEIRTMQKDIVRIRELESQKERDRIAAIRLEKGAKKKIEERLEEKREEPIKIEKPFKSEAPLKIEEIVKQPEKEPEKTAEEIKKVETIETPIPKPIEVGIIPPPIPELPPQPVEKTEVVPQKEIKEEPQISETKETVELPTEIPQEFLTPQPVTRPRGFQGFLFNLMVVFFVVAILSLIYLLAGLFYWYFFVMPTENPLTIISPVGELSTTTANEAQIVIPLSLIETNATEFLDASNTEEIPNLLSQVMKKSFNNGSTTRILIKDTENNKILGLREFFQAFKISPPNGLLDDLDNDFTLFIYTTTKNQLGFITKITEKENFNDLLSSWEPTMEKDTTDLFAILGKKGSGYSTKFKSSVYKNVNLRCLSFTTPNYGICWSTYNDYFIWTTSGESMVKIINDLIAKNQ